jgi:hypothetical protein
MFPVILASIDSTKVFASVIEHGVLLEHEVPDPVGETYTVVVPVAIAGEAMNARAVADMMHAPTAIRNWRITPDRKELDILFPTFSPS